MKTPITSWSPDENTIVATTNSRYETKGEVTITVPFEIAAMLEGMFGRLPNRKRFSDGSEFRTMDFFDRLQDACQKLVGGREALIKHPARQYGRDVIKDGFERPQYMG